MRLFLDPRSLALVAAQHREAYSRAEPFPHAVLDDVLPEDALDLAVEAFPAPESEVWKEYENHHEVKLETQGEQQVGDAISMLLYQFNSAPFLRFLEELTGIDGLIPDPYFTGGGLHQIVRGGKLGIHADFSRHPTLPLHRRLNVLIFLNRDWTDEYGGDLELWSTDASRCVKRIAPVFNRMVVFTITDWAFHGHPEPLLCPDGMTRKSIALYYFTVDRPAGETVRGKKSTLFIRRPGEDVPEGVVLARDAAYTGLKGEDPATRRVTRARAKRLVARVTPPVLWDAAHALRRQR